MSKKKNKIPKKVGGFKVPKSVRKSPLLGRLVASPFGRDILANAITAGAGAAVAVLVQEREAIAEGSVKAVKKGARKSKRAAGIASEAMQSAATAVMGVVADAAKNFMSPKAKTKKSRQAVAH
jgi:Pyruvate/2-oxoacid:ferredoxin oxidoreductase gamma subunit